LLSEVLSTQLKLPQSGVAVALNETIIPRSQWGNYQLSENDEILVIEAAQGG
jgi:sulfur carrier protein